MGGRRGNRAQDDDEKGEGGEWPDPPTLPKDMAGVHEAPVFYPTAEEFADPLDYMER